MAIKLNELLVSRDITIKDAMRKLNDTSEKIIFVTDVEQGLLGTISDGDIRRSVVNGRPLSDPVEKIMRKDYIFIERGDNELEKAKALMLEHVIDHIPILDHKKKLLDIISWLDFLEPKRKKEKNPILDNPVIIMAGGKGTRLNPFTKILPKPLIPLNDKPIIEHILERYYNCGFRNFYVLVNYKKEMIKSYFKCGSFQYDIEFIDENEFYGTAGGLRLIKDRIKNTMIVANSDTLLNADYSDILKWHKKEKLVFTIIGLHKEITVPYGVLKMNNGVLGSIDEKPRYDIFINTGSYILEPQILDLIGENEVLDMDKLILRGKAEYNDNVGVYPHWGEWIDVGQWDEYNKSLKHISESLGSWDV